MFLYQDDDGKNEDDKADVAVIKITKQFFLYKIKKTTPKLKINVLLTVVK